MMTIMKKAVPLILIILLLVGNVVYWGSLKEGFHIDEMFSYEQVGNTEYPKPEYDRPDEPCMNSWHSRDYYEDYLVISSEEAFDLSAFYQSASKNGTHPPLFLVLFGMFISAVSLNHFTKWSGIALNIIFFVLFLLIVYDIARRLLKKEKLALLAVLLSGSSVGMVSICIFIRPYMLLTVFTAALFDIHICMLEKKQKMEISLKNRIPLYVELALIFIGGSMSQYYFLVYAFFLCFMYWMLLLLAKERHMLLEYTLVMAVSFFLYSSIWPNVIRDLISGDRGVEAVSNFMGAEENYATEAVRYFRELDLQTTGGFFIVLIIAVLLAYAVRKIRKYSFTFRLDGKDGVSIRYTKEGIASGIRNHNIPIEWAMTILLVIPVICYVLLIARIAPTLLGEPYKTTRYIACIFPLVIIFVMFFCERIFLYTFKGRIWTVIIWPILVCMVLMGYVTSGVKYLYLGTSEQMNQLASYTDCRALFVTEKEYMSSNLNVYFTNHEEVLQTNYSGLSDISSILDEKKDDMFVVYISDQTENANDVIDRLNHELDVKGINYLFKTTGSNMSDVYLMKLKR